MGPPRPAPSHNRPARGQPRQQSEWPSQVKPGPKKQGRAVPLDRNTFCCNRSLENFAPTAKHFFCNGAGDFLEDRINRPSTRATEENREPVRSTVLRSKILDPFTYVLFKRETLSQAVQYIL